MTTFVLVHGAWHGAWCWNKLVPELEALGHRAVSFDLPGHGNDSTPRQTVTLDSYADRIVEVLDSLDEQVVLLGHSMGGMAITAAAELRPEKLKALGYLTAFLPRNGESLFAIEERNPRPSVPVNLVAAPDGKTAMVNPERVTDLFYHDCNAVDIAFATAHLTPQPLELLTMPVKITEVRFGSIPRIYIECTDDRAISIELQRDMIAASPCAEVISLPASHSPFFSLPQELAQALARLA
jgi:pimeloyl-ACP methyl ester carboxylesterase